MAPTYDGIILFVATGSGIVMVQVNSAKDQPLSPCLRYCIGQHFDGFLALTSLLIRGTDAPSSIPMLLTLGQLHPQ